MEARLDNEREAFSQTGSNPRFLPDKYKGLTERPAAQPRAKDIYPQIIASCIAHLLVIQAGVNMAYSAILLPQLMAHDSSFTVSTNEASWIASLMAVATPVGALICGPFMDLLGRKMFSLITVVPLALSWMILVFTPNSVWPLYVARVLAGFGGGLTTVSLVYISEITAASWRPMLLCLNSVFVSLGILLTNTLGVYLPWRVVALAACCICLASGAAIAIYNPESPYWLLNFHPHSDKHFELAKKSLHYLYPNQQMFAEEWERMVRVSREAQSRGSKREGLWQRTVVPFTQRAALLPLALLMTIFLFQQLSGTYPIVFYAVQVFRSLGGNFGLGLNEDSATILLGIIRFIMSLLAAGLSRSFGRRQLLIFSGVGMTISSFIAAIYLHRSCVFKSVFSRQEQIFNVKNTTNLTGAISYMPQLVDGTSDFSSLIGLVCILIFVSMSSVGLLIIPWSLVGEILPLPVRGTGGGFIISYAYVLMFGIVKVFPFLLGIFHISGLFYFFSFTSLLNVIVIYFFLPETLGRSFEEIEKFFVKSHTKT